MCIRDRILLITRMITDQIGLHSVLLPLLILLTEVLVPNKSALCRITSLAFSFVLIFTSSDVLLLHQRSVWKEPVGFIYALREPLHMHSKVFKKFMLAVPLDYLTRGQCDVQCKQKKQTREGAPRSPRYGHYATHARSLYGQNRSHQSPSQLFQCRHEALLPSDDTKTAARKTKTSPPFQKPPLFNFQIISSKSAYFTLINY